MTERDETIAYLMGLTQEQLLSFDNLDISKRALILVSDYEFYDLQSKFNFLNLTYDFATNDYNCIIFGAYIFIKESAQRY